MQLVLTQPQSNTFSLLVLLWSELAAYPTYKPDKGTLQDSQR